MQYENNPKQKLEQAVAEMRGQQPDAETVKAAGDRVWQHLSAELQQPQSDLGTIHGCSDVRALLVHYNSGQLPPARALLVEDHLKECVNCRSEAERGRRRGVLQPWKNELPQSRPQHFRWLAAVAAVVVVGVGAYFIQERLAVPGGSRAQVESVSTGSLLLVGLAGERPLHPGDQLAEGEHVRTSSGGRAMLRLADGSHVEMNEHAEFSVSMRRKDTTIDLERGNIIVQAAKRSSGHLYVAARDCRVSVTGTVFSVNSGIKGSRVSVIEGEVRVAENGNTNILHPGDQLSTSASLAPVSLRDEIAWSQNLDQHLKLLAEFVHLQKKLEAQVQLPGLRYESKLLPLLPQSTMVYAGVPNYAEALDQAYKLFQQELKESAVLRDWWEQSQAGQHGPDFQQAVDTLHQFGQYLGNEIVFSANLNGHEGSALIIAQVQKPGLKDFIQGLLTAPNAHGKHGLQVFDEQELAHARPEANNHGLFIVIRHDFVIAGFDLSTLQAFNAQIGNGGGGFNSTAFGKRMLQAYHEGAGILLGVDLQQLESNREGVGTKKDAVFQQTGFADLRYLVAERKDTAGQTTNRAELTFNGPRHGIASWLGAPAPIGGLGFVSPNAGAVGSFISKDPAQIFDDISHIAGAANPDYASAVARVESELKIRLREDLASSLGGEVTFALDGPILPIPSWKVIIEVYNPSRLQQTFEQLVADASNHGAKGLSLQQEVDNGLTYHTLHFTDGPGPAAVEYTFTDGFLVMGPSKAMVMEAVRIHQSGNSLANSRDFHALLPADASPDVSALLYQNLAPSLGPIAQQLSPSQMQSLQSVVAEAKPSVVCAYGEKSAIRVASSSRLFGMDLNTLALSMLLKMSERRNVGVDLGSAVKQ